MVTVRPSRPGDVPAQRRLWKLAFGDGESYIDNFYSTYYRPERVVVLEADEKKKRISLSMRQVPKGGPAGR